MVSEVGHLCFDIADALGDDCNPRCVTRLLEMSKHSGILYYLRLKDVLVVVDAK